MCCVGEQLDSVQTKGVCTAPFFPHGAENNPQHWELGAGYIESYKAFPEMPALAAALAVPTLLIHGKDDIHVPFPLAFLLALWPRTEKERFRCCRFRLSTERRWRRR